MCGIVYAHDMDGNPVNNAIMQQFDEQRSRGTEGFGLFDGQEKNLVKAAKENKILKWLCRYESNLVLFHHRRPTSTINVKRAAHPFSTRAFFGDDQYILVHNGHISNARDMKEKHEELGIKYQSQLNDGTFNDSEALAWDMALVLEGQKEHLESRGAIAFVCMKLHKGELDRLYFGRNSNPLNMKRYKNYIALSSEGEGDPIVRDTLYNYNYKLNRLTTKVFNIPQYVTYPVTKAGNQQNWNWQNQSYSANRPGTAGDWLPEGLRERMAQRVEQNLTLPASTTGGVVLDYDRDGNPIYKDNNFEPEDEYDGYDDYLRHRWGLSTARTPDEFLTAEKIEELEAYTPEDGEIQSKALEYLCNAKGHFETAYWAVELDYDSLLDLEDEPRLAEDTDRTDVVKERILTEKIMEYLQCDPEYVNEKSVSSMWEALWSKPKTTRRFRI